MCCLVCLLFYDYLCAFPDDYSDPHPCLTLPSTTFSGGGPWEDFCPVALDTEMQRPGQSEPQSSFGALGGRLSAMIDRRLPPTWQSLPSPGSPFGVGTRLRGAGRALTTRPVRHVVAPLLQLTPPADATAAPWDSLRGA